MATSSLPIAHCRDNGSEAHDLAEHLSAVSFLAARFAEIWGAANAARLAGQWHDLGKYSTAFQNRIRGETDAHIRVIHAYAGAQLALQSLPTPQAELLAMVIAGHHGGLPDWGSASTQTGLTAEYHLTRALATHPPAALLDTPPLPDLPSEVDAGLWTRMVASAVYDADFLDAERFFNQGKAERRSGWANLDDLLPRFEAGLAEKRAEAKASPCPVDGLRDEVLAACRRMAEQPQGLFSLTVPTGGGKTLSSLAFALAHARCHGLKRVIYAVPFTSIIEQNAEVFRKVLGDNAVLEHHSAFDWEDAAHRVAAPDGGGGRDGLGALRRAAANWDAPVIATTAVQFFESLFACRTSACRKLHNIVDSVVILDEAQTLPGPLLLPCLAVLDELQRNYRVSPVLCTATQPALRRQDGALRDKQGTLLGLDIDELRELAPRPRELHDMLRRVSVEIVREPVPDETIAARFVDAPRMLCIVNSRAHARALFGRIAALRGAAHLTTLMCPIHRRRRLAELRQRLKDGEPVRLVATSLVEAGVDISFPEVWRALAGVDAIAQAGGRCNREGELLPALGRVVVFRPVEERIPRTFQPMRQAAESVLRDHAADPLSLDALRAYFAQLYFQKGIEALDAKQIGDLPGRGVLAALQATARNLRFPFRSIAEAFRLIDEVMVPVVVPYDADAEQALEAVASPGPPSRDALRQLRQFTVGVPRAARDAWLASGDIRPVRQDMGEALLRFVDRSHYHEETGVELTDPMQRAAENNIW